MKSNSAPIVGVLIASAAALTGMILAATADSAGVRIVGALLATLVPIGILSALRGKYPNASLIAMILVPTLLFAVGIGVVAGIADGPAGSPSSTTAGSGGPAGGVTEKLPSDPSARLREALDKADELIPHGSQTLLAIDLDERSTRVSVYDPNTGDEVRTYGSDGDWYSTDRSRATKRRTFARADLAGLDLNRAAGEVRKTAAAMKLDSAQTHPADGIDLARRDDDLLVARFTVARRPIEVDMRGEVAQTAGAGFLDTALPTAQAAMRKYRLDPAAPILRQLDFMAIEDGSSSVGASAIQSSGGVLLDFDSGPYESIKIVPGCFPEPRPRNSREYRGFPLTVVSTATLIKTRDDLLARNGLAAFDGEPIAFRVGTSPGDRSGEVVLRMRLGPVSDRAQGVYTTSGLFLRSGSY